MRDSRRKPVVAVIGAASASAEEQSLAEEVGRRLAEAGAVLACGGRGGVMEAACRGAQQAGGLTIGILPGIDPDEGNPYLSLALSTGLGQARNAVVILAAEAVIAVGGGYGTLSEIGHALKAGKPFVGLRTWEASRRGKGESEVPSAPTAQEAVERILEAIRNQRSLRETHDG
jgi:uncharacterized protein (TIGR00725 family)